MTDRPQRYQRQESDTPETDIRDRRQPQRHMRPTPEVNTDTNDRGRRQRHWRQTDIRGTRDKHQIHERQISETDFRHRDKRGGHLKHTLAARKTYARRSISFTTDKRSRETGRYHRHHTSQAAETDVRGGRDRRQTRKITGGKMPGADTRDVRKNHKRQSPETG